MWREEIAFMQSRHICGRSNYRRGLYPETSFKAQSHAALLLCAFECMPRFAYNRQLLH